MLKGSAGHGCSLAKESYLDLFFPSVGRCGWMRCLLRAAVFE